MGAARQPLDRGADPARRGDRRALFVANVSVSIGDSFLQLAVMSELDFQLSIRYSFTE